MREIRQILALVNDSPRSARVLTLAAHLARQHGAALAAVHAVEPLRSGAFISPRPRPSAGPRPARAWPRRPAPPGWRFR